ncbi:hypothetical protein SBF1_500007 [Candidatus Desulfosporosinus infrequens]|uniref:Uncharacterized protein n=1 Tax=Candidatus Desulfosporosinus infrequens TaxID=2043169 RepID=A0A2U3LHG8_9FIRM|nr:hypothetical protein SBF1_500007 [Candidatus Desulfosporosinus infrequens]
MGIIKAFSLITYYNDSAAETPCHAINITFYCHPDPSLSLRMTPK